jgi:adenylylsulfate kinase-like enzyme
VTEVLLLAGRSAAGKSSVAHELPTRDVRHAVDTTIVPDLVENSSD